MNEKLNELSDERLRIIKKLDEQASTDVMGMFVQNQTGGIKNLLSNIRIMIELEPEHNRIEFNEFTHEVTLDKEPINDGLLDDFRVRFDTKYQVKFSDNDILSVLNVMAREQSYHPIKDFIESKKWDSVPRVEKLFIDYLGADDNQYIRDTTRKWLAGAVARIYEPGIKFEIIPILQGTQGIGKSTIAAKLGGDYFTDSLQGLGKTKDDYQLLASNWIVELGELASMNSTETETIKGFTSATEDKLRLPYGRMTQIFKRTVAFIGTTNNFEYLTDMTGNRRFFPIPLDDTKTKADVFELNTETIQQIWAEAYIYYVAGEKLYLDDPVSKELAEQYRGQATEQNLIAEDIEDYLQMTVDRAWNNTSMYDKRMAFLRYQDDGKTLGDEPIDRTTAKEIVRVVFDTVNNDRNQKSMMKQVKLYMDNLDDWERKPIYINKKTVRGYSRM